MWGYTPTIPELIAGRTYLSPDGKRKETIRSVDHKSGAVETAPRVWTPPESFSGWTLIDDPWDKVKEYAADAGFVWHDTEPQGG